MAENRRFRSVLEPEASSRCLHGPRRVHTLAAGMRWGWEGEREGAGLAPPRHAYGKPGSPEWLKTDVFGRFWSPKQARWRAWRPLAMRMARLGAQNGSK